MPKNIPASPALDSFGSDPATFATPICELTENVLPQISKFAGNNYDNFLRADSDDSSDDFEDCLPEGQSLSPVCKPALDLEENSVCIVAAMRKLEVNFYD